MTNKSPEIKRILLVEDDEGSARYIETLLQDRWDLTVAFWAEDAWDILQTQHIDLILMDISLPGDENGLDLTRRIRRESVNTSIPIIAVTAHAYARDRENCLMAGCQEYISKPFDRDAFFSLIERFV